MITVKPPLYSETLSGKYQRKYSGKAVGKWENDVLAVDTTMSNGRKFHDAWTLSPDKKHYTNEIVISGRGSGGGGAKGGTRTVKSSFTEQE